MTQIDVSTDESRVIAVLRAIKQFDNPGLIDRSDLGDAVDALEAVFNLEEKEKDGTDLKVLILGFVAGLGASRIPEVQALAEQLSSYETHTAQPPKAADDQPVAGGASSAVKAGQGNNSDYVTQSGVH